MTTAKTTVNKEDFKHLSAKEQAEAFQQISSMEQTCDKLESEMKRKRGEYNSARNEYTKAVANMRETIRSWSVPGLFDPKGKGSSAATAKPKARAAKPKAAKSASKKTTRKKTSRRGGLDHPAVKAATGQEAVFPQGAA